MQTEGNIDKRIKIKLMNVEKKKIKKMQKNFIIFYYFLCNYEQ